MPTERAGPSGALAVLVAALALVSLSVGFGAVDLVSPWVIHEGTQVSDVGYGTLAGLVIPVGLLAQLHRPTRRVAGVQQVAAAALAYLVAGTLAGERLADSPPALVVAVAVARRGRPCIRQNREPPARASVRPNVPAPRDWRSLACAPGSAVRASHGVQPAGLRRRARCASWAPGLGRARRGGARGGAHSPPRRPGAGTSPSCRASPRAPAVLLWALHLPPPILAAREPSTRAGRCSGSSGRSAFAAAVGPTTTRARRSGPALR